MELSNRQKKIIQIVQSNEPISGANIAKQLSLSRATLRNDLSLLTMTGILDARPKVGYFYAGQEIEPLLFDQLYQQTVATIMVPPVFITQSATINDAIAQLFMYDVGSLYILNERHHFVGLVSRKDLLRATMNTSQTAKTPVAVVMSRTPNIITVDRTETILQAGQRLIAHEVDSLPVTATAEPHKIIGKVTKSIVMRHFIEYGLNVKI